MAQEKVSRLDSCHIVSVLYYMFRQLVDYAFLEITGCTRHGEEFPTLLNFK